MLQTPDFVDTLRGADDSQHAFEIITDADRKIGG
jgi:hypothetical protein